MFLFKMSMDGDNNGCDLMKRIQLGGDLQITWIMFDHVKHVQVWTTFAYHVYDLIYFKVMMITFVTCNLKK
jgi:hypothetical protein